jgi:iron complex outermembrane receptor protein
MNLQKSRTRILLLSVFISALLQLEFSSAAAQSRSDQKPGSINGLVLDVTGDALAGANVRLEGTLLGAVADKTGRFEIIKLRPGNYFLSVTFIGYRAKRLAVEVRAGEAASVVFRLQESPIQLEQVVITASKRQEDLQEAVNSVSVLSARDIERRNSFRVDKALESVPGVNLTAENVNIRGSTGYSRGAGSRVLVLLDGVPALTSDLGAMNWDIVPITDVERVEVVKGAGSALYGTFALGGIINIITKPPTTEGRLGLRLSAGIYDDPSEPEWKWTNRTLNYNRTDLYYSRQAGKLGMRFSAGRHESTGDRVLGHFQRLNFTGKLAWNFNNGSTLTLFGAYSYDHRGEFIQWKNQNEVYEPPPEDLANRLKLNGATFYLNYRAALSSKLSLNTRVSLVRQLMGNQFNVSSDFQPAMGSGAEIQATYLPHPQHALVAGVELHHDGAESRHYGKHEAYTISPYIQETWKPVDALQVSGGLRLDYYNLINGETLQEVSPRLGLSVRPFSGTIFHAAAGRGFRAPTIAERFVHFEFGFRVIANPNLKPEQSISYDFGVRQQFGNRARAEVNFFSTSYRELIDPTPDAAITVQFLNFPRARIQGIETAGAISLLGDHLRLEATATWMDPRDLMLDAPLQYRPRFIAYVTPSLSLGPFTAEADYRYASRMELVRVYPEDQRVPQKQLDARLLYRWKDLTAQFAVRNVLNYNYAQIERNMNEVRNFAVGVQVEY